ncbi:MAG: hypothetical protein OXN97_09885 [Bryobacterales bacterium]|nr:hypothetical protein [Bryobacterales bacterium]
MIDDISHGAGNLSWLGRSTGVQDWSNLCNEHSLPAQDVPQWLVVTFNHELPAGRGKAVGSDWSLATDGVLGG